MNASLLKHLNFPYVAGLLNVRGWTAVLVKEVEGNVKVSTYPHHDIAEDLNDVCRWKSERRYLPLLPSDAGTQTKYNNSHPLGYQPSTG